MSIQAFISYKSEQRSIATRVRNTLQQWGYKTWLDQDDIATGQYFRDEIQNGLESSDIVIGILSSKSLASREVLAEWDYGYTRRRLLLLMYEAVDLPYWLRIVQYIDCTSNETSALANLQGTLKAFNTTNDLPAQPPEHIKRHRDIPSVEVDYDLTKSKTDDRSRMLYNVYKTWIAGALYPNLPAGELDLGVSLQPQAVLSHVDYGDYKLPASGQDIEKAFVDLKGQLLILGDPGSGKTILLLKLAERLLAQAEQDPTRPIPVVFNLASWAKDLAPLSDWLVDEMDTNYGVPRHMARRWVENGKLTLLLDGFDEIAPSKSIMPGSDNAALDKLAVTLRSKCVLAINTYCKINPNVDLVVCSRTHDYAALTEKLNLNAAIHVSELDEQSIDHYLADEAHAGTRELIREDPVVRAMAKRPFLLTMMKTAYKGMPYINTPFNQLMLSSADPNRRRDHLLAAYIDLQLNQNLHATYTQHQIRFNLQWLGHQMLRERISVFYVRIMQPDWTALNVTFHIVVRAIFIMIGGLVGLLLGALNGVPTTGVVFGMIGGIIPGPSLGLSFWTRNGLKKIRFPKRPNYFYWLVQRQQFSVQKMRSIAIGTIGGFIFGLCIGLIIAGDEALTLGIINGAIVGLATGFMNTSEPRHVTMQIDADESTKNGMINGVVTGMIFGIPVGLASLFIADPVIALTFGLGFGLSAALSSGWFNVILHLSLRLVLMREGVMRFQRYDHFLDHCAKIGLLRKVGSGYIFRHRLLLEYFAEQRTHPQSSSQSKNDSRMDNLESND